MWHFRPRYSRQLGLSSFLPYLCSASSFAHEVRRKRAKGLVGGGQVVDFWCHYGRWIWPSRMCFLTSSSCSFQWNMYKRTPYSVVPMWNSAASLFRWWWWVCICFFHLRHKAIWDGPWLFKSSQTLGVAHCVKKIDCHYIVEMPVLLLAFPRSKQNGHWAPFPLMTSLHLHTMCFSLSVFGVHMCLHSK